MKSYEERKAQRDAGATMRIYCKLLLKDGSVFNVTVEAGAEYEQMFHNINVAQEFCSMEMWLRANTERRKTRRGINRFVTNWLIRATNQQATPSRVAMDAAVGRNDSWSNSTLTKMIFVIAEKS